MLAIQTISIAWNDFLAKYGIMGSKTDIKKELLKEKCQERFRSRTVLNG